MDDTFISNNKDIYNTNRNNVEKSILDDINVDMENMYVENLLYPVEVLLYT